MEGEASDESIAKTELIANTSISSDINAEMLIAIPHRIPSPYLVPPPFPQPLSVLIKRKPSNQMASRRYYQDPRPFTYHRNRVNRIPVNSIQDILNQMERESTDNNERISHKKPKRINFYGRYKHRPNRPKVVPIRYVNEDPPPMRDTNPSVANDVNHLITHSVPHREPPVLYPNPSAFPTTQPNGLYEQIIATNKHRQEINKEAKPFSLMLDIYPMTDENKTQPATTIPPPLPPPQLPPLQIDHSYYDSIRFPQIHPTYNPINHYPVMSTISPNDEPEKMVVHLNLYPTKKNKRPIHFVTPSADPMSFFNDQEEEVFMPIINPQVYYRSRSSDDKENQSTNRNIRTRGDVVDIPRRKPYNYPYASTGTPRIKQSVDLGPPINITDYRTTIAPQVINRFLYGEGPPEYTYLGHFNSNEIGRRVDVQVEDTTMPPEQSTRSQSNIKTRNSHQPDNPMVVENLSFYTRSAIEEQPSLRPIS